MSKGVHVANLAVVYDGSSVDISYVMIEPYVLKETHLYVDTLSTTVIAPGQYGNIHENLGGASSDNFTISGFSGEEIFIVAHAVSCELK